MPGTLPPLADGLAQHEERTHHEHDADGKADDPVLHEAGDDEADKRDGSTVST